jgi:protein SCO1/2
MFSCDSSEIKTTTSKPILPFYQDASFTPQWLENFPNKDTFHHISPFQLINQEGKEINNETFAGKIYIADFFFTFCPGICPKMTNNMLSLQDTFLHDNSVLLLSHSVTPTRDSVPILQQYADRKGILKGKWHLVTGNKKTIYRLGRKDYFIEENLGLEKEEDAFLHTENFVLVDKNGFLRGIYNGLNKAALQQLIKDVRTLQQE